MTNNTNSYGFYLTLRRHWFMDYMGDDEHIKFEKHNYPKMILILDSGDDATLTEQIRNIASKTDAETPEHQVLNRLVKELDIYLEDPKKRQSELMTLWEEHIEPEKEAFFV